MLQKCIMCLLIAGVLLFPATAGADIGLTYLGAFKAFSASNNVYDGGLTYYPAGNGGAGSLFISRGYTGTGAEIYELTIPALVITSNVNSLNTATTLTSFDVGIAPYGLVWRSTDDKLYYSTGATGAGSMNFRYINRNGTSESATRSGAAWLEGGYGLGQVPDAWATSQAAGKNIMTVGPVRGIVFSSVDPWNSTVTVSQLWKYGTNPEMTGSTFGDTYNGFAWVEIGSTRDFVISGSDLPGPVATLWCMRVSDFENRASVVPQPYQILSVQSRMFVSNKLNGLAYDATNRILYAYEGVYNGLTIVHAWQASGPDAVAPAAVTNLATSNPTGSSVTLTWTAPGDDGSTGTAASYDIRYSTSTINDANWASATQVSGEPTPAAAGTSQNMVVSGLSSGTTYYFAMKTSDEVPNVSALSNVPSRATLDVTAPAGVTNLAAGSPTSSSVTLSWTAPGDDGSTGTAGSYDIRYSTSTITEGNWASATQVTGEPTPAAAGTNQNMVVSGLTGGTTYYFAMKTSDEVPNVSALSNVPSAATTTGVSQLTLTYMGAFKAFAASNGVYDGGLAFYPSGNGGAGSLFISRGYTGTGAEVYELTIPALVITSNVNSLNTATTLTSFDVGLAPQGLVWRSTDDKLYYSTGATGSGSMNFRYISRNGTGESATRSGAAWLEGGYGLGQVPDAWATAQAAGKNIMTVGPVRGIVFSSVDPWNSTVTVSQLWKYGTNPEMTGSTFGDTYNGFAWVETGGARDFVISGSDLPGPVATLWCMRVSDFENRGSVVPQPYQILSVQSRMFTTANALDGLAYDATNRILYAYEGIYNGLTIVHAWQASGSGAGDITAPAAVTNLATSSPTSSSITLTWTAPGDDGSTGTATSYDIRYRTGGAVNDSNWASATQVTGEPTPAAAGTVQSKVVTGLSAGTTYYFAIKTSDEVPNTSAISNSPSGTTSAASDTTAPAAVTNLAAGSPTSSSVTLSWTAPGDDGSTGTAASYDIRYSTSAITTGNWASATQVSGEPIPAVAGTSQNMVVSGLSASTTYYFAIKTSDEVPNVSGLSNVPSATTTAPGSVITTVTIVEKDGVTTSNYPMTLSMGFKQGDVANNVTVRVGGQDLATQTDVKVRWPDNSVRHAMVSFILPQVQASQTLSIEMRSGGTNYNSTWMSRDDLLATDFQALMAMVSGGQSQNASARAILQGMAQVEYWLQGSICTEFIIRNWATRYYNQLNVSYRVRVYPTINKIRVSTVVENAWIDTRGSITYNFTLSLGNSNPQTVFSKTAFKHFQSARWHKVFWQGGAPSKIETRYNLAYWIAGGFVPNYDANLVVPTSTITSAYSSWSSSAHDIMDGAGLTKYFPTTGGRSEIGPYPLWTSQYLCSMDYRMAEVTINYGDLSGSIPIHFREADAARSFYRHPISVDDRPTIWTTWLDNNNNIAQADKFPNPIGDISTAGNGDWVVDLAHQPSLAYIPYLITGDLYYLEEMHFWASLDIGASNGGYRGFAQGWLIDQIRGNAWAFRNIVDAAAMTPTSMPERAYLEAKISNNITRWNTVYIVPAQYPAIRTYGAGDYTSDPAIDPAYCSYASGIWQDDYLTWAFIHAKQMGYSTQSLIDWGGLAVIDRFRAWPGWNRYRGAPYAAPVKGWDASHNPAPYQTWADVNNGFTDKVGPSSFTGEYPNSYTFAARGVMALVTNMPNGLTTWNWLDTALTAFKGGLPSDPRWAFVPVP